MDRLKQIEAFVSVATRGSLSAAARLEGVTPAIIGRRLDAGFVSLGDASMSSFVADFEWESFRSSGLGRSRMGPAGIARYLRTKAIAVNRGPAMPVTDSPDS